MPADPPDPHALTARASALLGAGRWSEAVAAYQDLLAVRADLPNSWFNLGHAARKAGEGAVAVAAFDRAIALDVERAEEAHLERALALAELLGRPDEAQAALEAALRMAPRYVPALLNLGNLHEDRGRRPEARDAYERVLAIDPTNALALARLAVVAPPESLDDPLIDRLRAGIASRRSDPAAAADLGFALGAALDRVGAYDAAFAAYADANRATGLGGRYDRGAQEALVDRLITTFPAAQTAPATDDPPIFICGLFRSGSTLCEQILARHPAIRAGGELALIPRVAAGFRPYPEAIASAPAQALITARDAYLAAARDQAPGTGTLTDKRPDNFLHIGLIKTLFPSARIVHTRRDPIDNCLSIFFLHLDRSMPYAADLDDIAHWHGQYCRLMAHWRSVYDADILDLDYDALVADPEPQIAALLGFLGLEDAPGLLDFHRADSAVRTASVWQVREPLYRRSSGRWRNYAKHLNRLSASIRHWL